MLKYFPSRAFSHLRLCRPSSPACRKKRENSQPFRNTLFTSFSICPPSFTFFCVHGIPGRFPSLTGSNPSLIYCWSNVCQQQSAPAAPIVYPALTRMRDLPRLCTPSASRRVGRSAEGRISCTTTAPVKNDTRLERSPWR